MGIAFEYNGKQHYYLSYWADEWDYSEEQGVKRYIRTNLNDLAKLSQCEERGAALTVLSYFDYSNDWYDIIINQYELCTGKEAPQKQLLDYRNVLCIISKERVESL